MDLNLLAALDALLQEGSVVGAAERLHLTPPAMSRALGRLRQALDDPLFVRAGRGLVPTPRALALRDRVHAALHEATALLRPEAPTQPEQMIRRFTVRTDDAVTTVLGPTLLQRGLEIAPGITVVFRAEGDEDVRSLREGHVDLDIGVQGELAPEIRIRKLFDDRRVILVGRRSRHRTMSAKQLARHSHVDISRRGRTRGPLDDALEQQGLARRVIGVVPTHLSAAILVAQTDAVSLVSEHFAEAVSKVLDVRWFPCPVSLPSAAIAMTWHPRFDADRGHIWFRTEVAELVRARIKRVSKGK